MGAILELVRPVTRKECSWLGRDFKQGDKVYRYLGCTYGYITRNRIACTLDSKGGTSFFELPRDSVQAIPAKPEGYGGSS